MSEFESTFWDVLIIVVTLASIAALFFLTRAVSKGGDISETSETTGHVWDEDLTELNNPLPRWWRNLFYITLAFGVIYLALYPGLGSYRMMLGWTQIGQYEEEMAAAEALYGPKFNRFAETDIETLSRDPDAQKVGERLFASYCATCHGSDARGSPGFPNLTDADWLYGGTPQAIKQTILEGRTGAMPGWGPALGGDEGVQNVTQYVLSLAGRKHDAAMATAGKPKYDIFCVACHLPTGTGNTALGAPNLTDSTWLYGASDVSIAQTIADGRTGKMPPHRNFLGEAKSHVLAAYVYGLSR